MGSMFRALLIPPVIVAACCGIALRIVFIIATPIEGNKAIASRLSAFNDEGAHGEYIRHIVLRVKLPTIVEPITAPGALERGQFENYQPPLYYGAVAAVCRLTGSKDLGGVIRVGRWMNLVLGLTLLWIAVGIFRALAHPAGVIAAAMVFLLLSGVMVRFTSTASNDPLFWVLSGAAIWVLILIRNGGLTVRRSLLFGIIAAASIYAKLSAILILPLLLPAIWIHCSVRQWLISGAVLVLIVVVTLPVWIRNVTIFGGLLPLQSGFGPAHWRVPDIQFLAYVLRSFVFPWSEFWQGAYGLLFIAPPAILLLVGLKQSAAMLWANRASVIPAVQFFIVAAAFLWLNFRYDQAEARYVFAAWPFLASLALPFANSRSRVWLLTASMLWPYALFLNYEGI